ncbi:cadherin repeat domain-containing protein, partial [Mesorhizobium sp. M0187]
MSDNAGGRFGINAITGVVTVANASLLNYETATSHTITVQASDGHGGITTQSFTIAVTDVAPSTPTDTNAAANTVAEGATAGTLVGVTASSRLCASSSAKWGGHDAGHAAWRRASFLCSRRTSIL